MAYNACPSKSTPITNLDATPPVRATAGQGGTGRIIRLQGTVTPPAAMTTSQYIPIVRIPTNAIVKGVFVLLDAAATTLTGSMGLIFSDTNDGTPIGYQSSNPTSSAAPSIVSQSFFCYQLAMATYAAVPGTDPSNTVGLGGGAIEITFANSAGNSVTDGFYVPSSSNLPLWQALSTGPGKATSGASPGAFATCQTDPGGFFDVTWFETTTGSAANVKMTVFVDLIEAGANL